MTLDEAMAKAKNYPYVLLWELSRVHCGKADQVETNWAEVTQARFFDDKEELRFWYDGGELRFAVISDETMRQENEELDYLDKAYPLDHQGAFGTRLDFREYLRYDEDGQLYVAGQRLKGWC